MSAPASSRPSHRTSVKVVCPDCHGGLVSGSGNMLCTVCKAVYPMVDGRADLIIGERYTDPTPEQVMLDEEVTNRRTVEDFWAPTFRRLFGNQSERPRVLSLGCGVGADVDALCDAGFDAVGIDCGERVAFWGRRKHGESFVLGNGCHMPFETGTFDAVFCGCVFPHVGVEGSSYKLTPNYQELRLQLAREMARVTKPSGRIICCNPNRWFPFDIFHGHTAGHVCLRPTVPWDPLLLSRRDYEEMFRQVGCTRAEGLPVASYWSFANSTRSAKGRLLAAPLRALFWLVSRDVLKPLRTSPLNPWIVVMIEKAPVRA